MSVLDAVALVVLVAVVEALVAMDVVTLTSVIINKC